MNVAVREYHPDDWLSVKNIVLEAENFGAAFLEHERIRVDIYSKNPEYGRVFVAEDAASREVLGFVAVRIDWTALAITTIIAHHERLREGIGSALVKSVERLATSLSQIETIWVDTADFMLYAHEFYKSCGFEEVARVPRYMSSNYYQVFFIRRVKTDE